MAADFIEGQRITTQYADPTKDRTGVISSVDTTDHITIKWDDDKQDNIRYSYGTAHRAFKVVDDDCPEATHVERPPLNPRTQHQMRNIGNGNDPDAPLRYVAELKGKAESRTNTIGHDIDLICGLKAKLDATSEQEARDILEAAWPYFNIESLELL